MRTQNKGNLYQSASNHLHAYVSSLGCLPERHLNTPHSRDRNLTSHARGLRAHVINLLKGLEKPDETVSHLCQGELLPDADPWSTVKWNIVPCLWCPVVPSLGLEFVSIWAEQVFPPLHDNGTVCYWSTLKDCNWLFPIWPTTNRECGVF